MLAPWPIGDKRTCRSDLCNNAPLHWLTKKFISKKLSQFTFGWRVFAIFVLGLHRGASTKKEDHTLIAHGFRES